MLERAVDSEVLIVGGGPAGSSAAIHLAQRGAKVRLIERAKFPRPKLCGEFISPECTAHFIRLGVMDAMLAANGAPISETVFYAPSGRNIRVPSAWLSAQTKTGNGALSVGAAGALGLSRAEMDARLLARARAVGVEVWEETQATNLVIENDVVRGVEVRCADGARRSCRASLLIDATGRARFLGRQREKRDGGTTKSKRASLVAFKAHLTNTGGSGSSGSGAKDEACEIYFYRGGYGGLNRVEGGVSNLCFIVAAQLVREKSSDPARVMREIVSQNKRAAETLKDARVESSWLSVALEGFGRHELVPASGLISIGDAASFIDPFTGSGMLMALESGALAAEVIAAELSFGEKFDLRRLQSAYEASYAAKFAARLRLCSALRRLAFAPPSVAEVVISVLGASERVQRGLARATRRMSPARVRITPVLPDEHPMGYK